MVNGGGGGGGGGGRADVAVLKSVAGVWMGWGGVQSGCGAVCRVSHRGTWEREGTEG